MRRQSARREAFCSPKVGLSRQVRYTENANNAQENLPRHHTSFAEAQTVCGHPLATTLDAPDHAIGAQYSLEMRHANH
jgi:hypothetical protein